MIISDWTHLQILLVLSTKGLRESHVEAVSLECRLLPYNNQRIHSWPHPRNDIVPSLATRRWLTLLCLCNCFSQFLFVLAHSKLLKVDSKIIDCLVLEIHDPPLQIISLFQSNSIHPHPMAQHGFAMIHRNISALAFWSLDWALRWFTSRWPPGQTRNQHSWSTEAYVPVPFFLRLYNEHTDFLLSTDIYQ